MSNQPTNEAVNAQLAAGAIRDDAAQNEAPRRAENDPLDTMSDDQLMDRAGIDRDLVDESGTDRDASRDDLSKVEIAEDGAEASTDTISVAKSPTLEEDVAAEEAKHGGGGAPSERGAGQYEATDDTSVEDRPAYDQPVRDEVGKPAQGSEEQRAASEQEDYAAESQADTYRTDTRNEATDRTGE